MFVDGFTLIVVAAVIGLIVASRKEKVEMGCGTFVVLVLILAVVLSTVVGGRQLDGSGSVGEGVVLREDLGR